MTTAIVAEKSNVHPNYYDPDTPPIIWYFRVLALHNARVDAEDYRRRKEEQKRKLTPTRRR